MEDFYFYQINVWNCMLYAEIVFILLNMTSGTGDVSQRWKK